MELFLYVILALGFVVCIIVLFSMLAGVRGNEKDDAAIRKTPQEEQQHEIKDKPDKDK